MSVVKLSESDRSYCSMLMSLFSPELQDEMDICNDVEAIFGTKFSATHKRLELAAKVVSTLQAEPASVVVLNCMNVNFLLKEPHLYGFKSEMTSIVFSISYMEIYNMYQHIKNPFQDTSEETIRLFDDIIGELNHPELIKHGDA